jgi:DNA-binding LytR/AlgR family response regulator
LDLVDASNKEGISTAARSASRHSLRYAVDTPGAPKTLVIPDGRRIVRARIEEVVAISAAGNYAEFQLTDGRHPLLRSTLGAPHCNLASEGFLRTHRSWIVNAAHVRAMEPENNGDYRLLLTDGSVALLTRRFADALACLVGQEFPKSSREVVAALAAFRRG